MMLGRQVRVVLLSTALLALFGGVVTPVVADISLVSMSSGIESELTVLGDQEHGTEFTIICRFTLPENSPRVLQLDSVLGSINQDEGDSRKQYYRDFVDTVVFYGDSNVVVDTSAIWTGKIVPGIQYELNVTFTLRKPIQSSIYVRCANRYGNDMLGVKKFYYGVTETPSGYVIDTLSDSLNNVTRKHRWVQDTTLPGFIRYNGKVLPPDTTFDSLGNIKFIIQRHNPDSLSNIGPRVIPKISPSSPRSSIDIYNGRAITNSSNADNLTSAAIWNASGIFQFRNVLTGQLQPCQLAEIWIFYKNIFGSWQFQFTSGTNFDGSFDVSLAEADALVLCVSVNPLVNVFFTDTHKNEAGAQPSVYSFGFQILNNTAFLDFSIPAGDPVTTKDLHSAPFYIADLIFEHGWNDFFNLTGEVIQSQSWTFWDSLNTANSMKSHFGGLAINGTPVIYIANKDTLNASGACTDCDMDEWDPAVIMHEYGHYLVWLNSQSSPLAFGPHNGISAAPRLIIDGVANNKLDLAYNEALAGIVGGVLRNSSIYVDSVHDSAVTTFGISANWERPLPDPPWVSQPHQWFGGSDETIDYPGEISEFGIVAVLWDIFDTPDDGDFFIGPTKFGHNNDFNSGSSYVGFQAIWDVLKNYDPQPLNSAHNHPWNIYEFVVGWKALGYPVDQVFLDIIASHDVPMFVAGDFNADGNFNISDITAFIAFVFQGGPAAGTPAEADVNADCKLNVADITVMIARIFSGGPPSLVGCTEP